MFVKTQVIVNPESDRGRTKKRWEHIKEALKFFLKEFKYEFTEKPFQAAEISRAAIKEGSELIVGVGGDGTMNEISNGFFENKKIINPKVALGIVPSGTGCDFSGSLNIPSGLKNALRVITQASSSMIDIGKIRFRDYSNKKHERFFLNIADFGIGGEVLNKMNLKMAKRKTSSYLRSAVTTLITYKSKRVRIKIDNMQIPFNEYLIGAISNGKIFGKGMKIAPYAKLDDGLFDVVLVESMKLLEFCRNILKIYSGSHLSHPKVSLIRGKKIEITPESSEKDVLIEADGELIGKLPATFEIIPQSFLVKSFLL